MSLSGRLLPPLLISLASCIAAHVLALPVTSTLLCLLGPFIICTTAPVPSTALLYAHIFRLNEALAAGLVQASYPLSLLLMAFLGATSVVSATLESFLPFATAVAAAAMSIALTTFLISLKHHGSSEGPPKNKVKMVYTANSPPAGVSALTERQESSSSAAVAEKESSDGASSGEEVPGVEQLQNQQERTLSSSEEEPEKPEKPRRSSFKDLGESGGSETSPPPPAAAAMRNMRRSLLRTPLNNRGINRMVGIRPRTAMSLLR